MSSRYFKKLSKFSQCTCEVYFIWYELYLRKYNFLITSGNDKHAETLVGGGYYGLQLTLKCIKKAKQIKGHKKECTDGLICDKGSKISATDMKWWVYLCSL